MPSRTSDPQRPRIVATTFDYQAGVARLHLTDGHELRFPVDLAGFPSGNRIAKVTYSSDLSALHCVTTLGDEVTAELPSLCSSSPRGDRLVIYLDQKDWRTLRDVRYDPESIPVREEREAAEALIRLVEADKVILPMSSGHLIETTKWSREDLRYQLGLTILQLSRGWQLLDPLAIRTGEVRAALTHRGQSRDLAVPNVITLRPGALRIVQDQPYRPPIQFPPQHALASQATLTLVSYFAVMLDAKGTEQFDLTGWVERQQQMSGWLAERVSDRAAADRSVDAFFVDDTIYEIARAASAVGISHSQLMAWLQHQLPGDVPKMPSLGLFREVLRERHLNRNTRWEESDLADLTYLTCAGGYADHVVGERQLTHHLARAVARLGRGVHVHRNLRELMAELAP